MIVGGIDLSRAPLQRNNEETIIDGDRPSIPKLNLPRDREQEIR
jgi:hypothetical protein